MRTMRYNLAERLASTPAAGFPNHSPSAATLRVPNTATSSPTPGVTDWMALLSTPQMQHAVSVVRELLADSTPFSREERDRRLHVLAEAQAGDPAAEAELKAQIAHLLEVQRLSLPAPRDLAVSALFESCWGLDVLAPIYHDPKVDEIRVNRFDRVYTVRDGRSYLEPIAFADEDHLLRVMRRLIMHDNVDITRDAPRVETTRRDGCRITATLPPFTRHPTLVIRKFTSIDVSPEAFAGALNDRILRMLQLLVRGRASILLSGATNTGKTTLLRLLVGFLPPNLRILTLETDFELNLSRYYPDRDIVEMEAHPELGLTLESAFRTVLRMTPDVIIMGEARGSEADEMVKAALRGHDGSMGTVHVTYTHEIIPAICNMILEEKPTRPLPVLRQQVATAFQILIQLVRWPSGRRQIEEITECYWDHEKQAIVYNPLVTWTWTGDDPEKGDWQFPNKPSDRLIMKLRRGGISRAELQEAGLL